MPRLRVLLGVLAAGLATVATVAALRALIINIKVALSLSAPGLILPGLLSPIVFAAAASVLFRLAYRNLFGRRYLAALLRAQGAISTAPPNER